MKRIAVLLLAGSLAACQTSDPDNQRAVGAMSGVILGAFIGYNMFGSGSGQTIMAALGAAAGGAGGYYAADYVIKQDQKKMEKAAFLSLDSASEGSTVYWENDETGSAGSFKVLRSFQSPEGRRCRELMASAMGELGTVEKKETACLLHNGAWEII